MWYSRHAFVCLLVIAGISEHALAARTWQQRREQKSPFAFLPPGLPTEQHERHIPQALGEKEFTLRHIYHHGAHRYPDLYRYMDIQPGSGVQVLGEDGRPYAQGADKLRVKVASTTIQRLVNRKQSDIDELLRYAEIHGEAAYLPSSAWSIDEIAAPNVTDKETVVALAKMTEDAYVSTPGEGDWMDIGHGWNHTDRFGWEDDGLRGHIFTDKTNSTIVISLKGTTVAVFAGADTSERDKENDNLFGSCCCGQGGQYLWHRVCDCMTSAYTCNNTCLVKTLYEKDKYFTTGRQLYNDVLERYPQATDVWLVGHSLGGVVASLLGLAYHKPAVTFEAYPDALAAKRLGLPVPPGYQIGSHQSRRHTAIYHVGHSADPIYTGACNSGSAWCTLGGYAFEGKCHTGLTCMYDTMSDFGWRPDAMLHKIIRVIKEILPLYDRGPTCEEDIDCSDCYNWKFYESNGTETTTTSGPSTTATSRIRTRTETCKTPGWWGCLDESTTTTATTTTSGLTTTTTIISSSSTSTCKTPGWFGCKDRTAATSSSNTAVQTPTTVPPTVTTSTDSSSISSSSSSCKTPGWLGCKDSTSLTSGTPMPVAITAVPTPSPTAPMHVENDL